MENVEKLRILLQHWIEHNEGHVAEFVKWQKIMADEKMDVLARHIGDAAEQVNRVSDLLGKALEEAGGSKQGDAHHHDHHHHHHD